MKDFLIKEFKDLSNYYLELRLTKDGKSIVGKIRLFDPITNDEFDSYEVKIEFPNQFPYCFAKVWETSNKIPKKPERHVNPDGSLCLGVIQEEIIITKKGIGIREFIEKILKPHLSRETYRRIKKKYPHGEYSHGIDGVLEYFYEKFNSNNPTNILEILDLILNNKLPERNERRCICGKENKFKKCHLPAIEKVQRLGSDSIALFKDTIQNYIKRK